MVRSEQSQVHSQRIEGDPRWLGSEGEARVHERARLMRVAVARQSISPLMQLVDLVRTLTKLTLGGP